MKYLYFNITPIYYQEALTRWAIEIAYRPLIASRSSNYLEYLYCYYPRDLENPKEEIYRTLTAGLFSSQEYKRLGAKYIMDYIDNHPGIDFYCEQFKLGL